MRIGLYQMSQETDTFNPLPTTMDDFAAFGLETGPEMLERHRGPSTIGGYLAAVEASGRERRDGRARPRPRRRRRPDHDRRARASSRTGSGPVSRAPGSSTGWRCSSTARAPPRASTTSRAGCSRSRGAALPPGVPIVLTIDHHANVTQAMVDGCDALVGYRTQPHDPFETAVDSTNLLLRIVAGEVRPTMAWRKIPLLSHQEQYLTSGGPMKTWFDRARAWSASPGCSRSRRSRCSRGWTWTTPAGRRSW